MTHIIYSYRKNTGYDTLGQSWAGESVDENVALCKYQTIEPFFLKHLPRNGKILEAGCGLGRWVIYLREKGYDIIGVDASREAIATSKKTRPEQPLILGDITRLPYRDGSMDAIISLGVVEHFVDGPAVPFSEIKRVLKKQGMLFISIPIENILRKLIVHPVGRLKGAIHRTIGHSAFFEEYRYTERQMERMLQNEDFKVRTKCYDDFMPPKNIGLYADFGLLHHKINKWELNKPGKFINAALSGISPKIHSSGCFWICTY